MLELAPVSLKQANAYVKERHRHHGLVTGHKFSLGAKSGGTLVGVAIIGRPVSRYLDNGETLEGKQSCELFSAFARTAQKTPAASFMGLHGVRRGQWAIKS